MMLIMIYFTAMYILEQVIILPMLISLAQIYLLNLLYTLAQQYLFFYTFAQRYIVPL